MPKPTKEHKARAKKLIQLMIHDWFLTPATQKESPEVKNEIYKELLRLEKQEQKLLNPPQPRKPSKPKAATLASGKLTSSTSVHFEPDGVYKNSQPKTGRQKS